MLIDLIKIVCFIIGALIGAYAMGRMFGLGFGISLRNAHKRAN